MVWETTHFEHGRHLGEVSGSAAGYDVLHLGGLGFHGACYVDLIALGERPTADRYI